MARVRRERNIESGYSAQKIEYNNMAILQGEHNFICLWTGNEETSYVEYYGEQNYDYVELLLLKDELTKITDNNEVLDNPVVLFVSSILLSRINDPISVIRSIKLSPEYKTLFDEVLKLYNARRYNCIVKAQTTFRTAEDALYNCNEYELVELGKKWLKQQIEKMIQSSLQQTLSGHKTIHIERKQNDITNIRIKKLLEKLDELEDLLIDANDEDEIILLERKIARVEQMIEEEKSNN